MYKVEMVIPNISKAVRSRRGQQPTLSLNKTVTSAELIQAIEKHPDMPDKKILLSKQFESCRYCHGLPIKTMCILFKRDHTIGLLTIEKCSCKNCVQVPESVALTSQLNTIFNMWHQSIYWLTDPQMPGLNENDADYYYSHFINRLCLLPKEKDYAGFVVDAFNMICDEKSYRYKAYKASIAPYQNLLDGKEAVAEPVKKNLKSVQNEIAHTWYKAYFETNYATTTNGGYIYTWDTTRTI